MALGGRPDDSAKMVWSRECIAYLCCAKIKGNAVCCDCCTATIKPNKRRSLRERPRSRLEFVA
jgi:hypothetical protein